ncbi:hypothetical protein [Sinorhizobium sp. BJ1]|uniref:hypothetical protein n=1 Tax=Sinorhizobium sp. BJ1 TaxID=2035455 RepID=UPI000BE85226|nr:hypothetical protein [Sinorhizobium sp. BJ1]PDT76946.1 hypothetical protein CO676_33580 [Sinorhizobium sp. BJ1]
MRRRRFSEIIPLVEHYLAIGEKEIYLDGNDRDLPWGDVKSVITGGCFRLNGPSSARAIAPHESGLTFTWFIDFEGNDANGTGTNQFSAENMLGAASKMPAEACAEFARMLAKEVWPAVKKNTDDIRDALRRQEDSLAILQSIMISVGKQVSA